MDYPGHIVKVGESDRALVDAITKQLAMLGYKLDKPSDGYDAALASLVKLFQSQHFDAGGRPLQADGQSGPISWGALFGAAPVTVTPKGIAGAALAYAVSQVGVMESPIGSNRGPQVDDYLRTVGAAPGSYWCMSFVHWCFFHAAKDNGRDNPFPKTAGCLDAWNRVKAKSPGCVITAKQAIADPSIVRPGFVFILDHGGGHGHTGFVRQAIGGTLRTVEGNSNPNGSSNGIGVFDLNRRKVTEGDLKGFLDFTAA